VDGSNTSECGWDVVISSGGDLDLARVAKPRAIGAHAVRVGPVQDGLAVVKLADVALANCVALGSPAGPRNEADSASTAFAVRVPELQALRLHETRVLARLLSVRETSGVVVQGGR
jgi:hypothetical protein